MLVEVEVTVKYRLHADSEGHALAAVDLQERSGLLPAPSALQILTRQLVRLDAREVRQ